MKSSKSSSSITLANYAHWGEKIFLPALVIGLIMMYTGMEIMILVMISLFGLAITYFLFAFIALEFPRSEDEKMGFMDLLLTSILPKVLSIGMAVSLFGMFLLLLDLGNDGHVQVLNLGGTTILTCIVILLFAGRSSKYLRPLTPLLIRSLVVVAAVGYILFIS